MPDLFRNLIYQTSPATYVDFVGQVTPILQQRGLAQDEYAPGTLRERMFPGTGAYLNGRHPAAAYRGAYIGQPAASLPVSARR